MPSRERSKLTNRLPDPPLIIKDYEGLKPWIHDLLRVLELNLRNQTGITTNTNDAISSVNNALEPRVSNTSIKTTLLDSRVTSTNTILNARVTSTNSALGARVTSVNNSMHGRIMQRLWIMS